MTGRLFTRCFRIVLFIVLLGTIAIGIAAGQTPSGHGYLHREHKLFVDGDGNIVELRGINFPAVPASYDIDLPDPDGDYLGGDQQKDDLAIDLGQLVTPAEEDEFLEAWCEHSLGASDVATLHGWGFNSIRLMIDYRMFYDPKTGQDRDFGFTYMDHLVQNCATSKVYVIFCMGFSPGGDHFDYPDNLFEDVGRQAILAKVWQRIAARYSTAPYVGGYDLMNEPADYHGRLVPLYRKLTAAIRKVDPNHMLILEGDRWSGDLKGLGLTDPSQLWDQNVALSFHMYDCPVQDHPDASGQYDETAFTQERVVAARLDVPLWLAEFGINSNAWCGRVKERCEHPQVMTVDGQLIAAPIGWCYLTYKNGTTTGMLRASEPKTYHIVRDYLYAWASNPKTPKLGDATAFAELMGFARSEDRTACQPCKDLIDALSRPDFTKATKPYAVLTIPGRIEAAYYDMGDQDMAYHDAVWDDEINDGHVFGHPWNQGWSLRNDGVSIAYAGDGSPYIGWTTAGEWLRYTVNCKPGTYTVNVRYSSGQYGSAASIHVTLGGVNLTGPVSQPYTGDWNSYNTLSLNHITVTQSGKQTMQVTFDAQGSNLNWIEFVPEVTPKRAEH
ncbi:MAG: cellulase family glycosylhydrolase [Capsulimonadaceae bacterium]